MGGHAHEFGQHGNMLLSLASGALLAEEHGRLPVLLPFHRKAVWLNPARLYDFQGTGIAQINDVVLPAVAGVCLCAVYDKSRAGGGGKLRPCLERPLPWTIQMWRVPHKKPPHHISPRMGYRTRNIFTCGRKVGITTEEELRSALRDAAAVPLVYIDPHVPFTFRGERPLEHWYRVWRHLRPIGTIRGAALDAVELRAGRPPVPYAALHIRQPSPFGTRLDACALLRPSPLLPQRNCSVTLRYATRLLASAGPDAVGHLFVASDGSLQLQELDAVRQGSAPLRVWLSAPSDTGPSDRGSVSYRAVRGLLVDMWVMASANWFVASPWSTISLCACLWRMARRGRDQCAVNVRPGYAEWALANGAFPYSRDSREGRGAPLDPPAWRGGPPPVATPPDPDFI